MQVISTPLPSTEFGAGSPHCPVLVFPAVTTSRSPCLRWPLQAANHQATQLSESVNKSNQRRQDDVIFLRPHRFFILALFLFLVRSRCVSSRAHPHTSENMPPVFCEDGLHLAPISCRRSQLSLGGVVNTRSDSDQPPTTDVFLTRWNAMRRRVCEKGVDVEKEEPFLTGIGSRQVSLA